MTEKITDNKDLKDYLNPVTESDTHKRLSKVKDEVETILKEDDKSRNSDKWLIYQYLLKVTGLDEEDFTFDNFKAMPSFESITRCRRKLQAEGLYLSNNQIAEKRAVEEKEFKEWARE